MNEQMIEMLKKLAGENTLGENMISAYEASGGNYDDAYRMAGATVRFFLLANF
jgi:hypothetical protein